MKAVLMMVIIGLALNASAKLSDFNDIIEENSKAQNELHASLTENMKETQVAVQKDGQKETRERFLVDTSSTINAPTKKSFLTFSKEKNYHRASEKQAQKRLAAEVDSAE